MTHEGKWPARRWLQIAAGMSVDLTVCVLVFWVRQPFLGDRGEYAEFLEFMPRAFVVIWILGRISTLWQTLRRPRKSLGFVLACTTTILLIATWCILGTTGREARGIGHFPGWQGPHSAADLLGLLLEPGWQPSWGQRIFDRALLVEIGVLASLFVFASYMTRCALRKAG